jgi:hypothetical protein
VADTLDVLTLTEGKDALRIDETDTDEETELAGYITAVSRLLDQRIGPVVRRSVTAETHHGGRSYIRLLQRPVASVTTLLEYSATTQFTLTLSTVTSQPSLGYALDSYPPDPALFSGRVWRRSGNSDYYFANGRGNVVATYSAGRYSSTTSVDARFKRAACVCLENLWRDRQHTVSQFGEFDVPTAAFPTFSLPRAVTDLLSDEIYWQRPLRAG